MHNCLIKQSRYDYCIIISQIIKAAKNNAIFIN